MTWWRRAQAWLRAHPTPADALLAILVIGPAFGGRVNALPGPPIAPTVPSQLLVVASCLTLILRRRCPTAVWGATLTLGVAVVLLQNGPSPALLPLLVSLYTLASRWPVPRALLAAFGSAGLLLVAQSFATDDRWDRATTYVVPTWCVLSAVVGISVRQQRRALAEARERARFAEESREEEAQRRVTEERLRIARELHDVVAHQIAVINVQSGVAEHLQAVNPDRAGEALRHVREASGQVLAEMGALLGVLRDGDADDAARDPVRGLDQLDELVASVRRTGLQVVVRQEGTRAALAPLVDVTAYRIVEEALTNAHKHGAGAAHLLLAFGAPGLVIEVTNPVEPGREPAPGSGRGLAGMYERVAAIGGTLRAGPSGRGQFSVRVELPAPAGSTVPQPAPAPVIS
ncbi:sensor histidine kinase [Nakamurella sp.]|uniref:sensor histidine kinase n=1 Tax=Nakamurella sp. TaxID=1869182 RepID=UPI003784CF44